MKLYIVLFLDDTMLPIRIKPRKQDYQEGCRFFEIDDNKTIAWLSDWYAKDNNLKGITEITNI